MKAKQVLSILFESAWPSSLDGKDELNIMHNFVASWDISLVDATENVKMVRYYLKNSDKAWKNNLKNEKTLYKMK